MPSIDWLEPLAIYHQRTPIREVINGTDQIWLRPVGYTAWTETRRNVFPQQFTSAQTLGAAVNGEGARGTRTGTGVVGLLRLMMGTALKASTQYRLVGTMHRSGGSGTVTIHARPDVGNATNQVTIATSIAISAANSPIDYTFTTSSAAPGANTGIAVLSNSGSVGDWIEFTGVLLAETPDSGGAFNGNTPDTDTARYSWVGAVGASAAIMESREVIPVDDEHPPAGDYLLFDDFQTATTGVKPASFFTARWPDLTVTFGSGLTEGRVSIAEASGNRYLRIKCEADKVGATQTGASFRSAFPDVLEATAEYRARFEPGFQWVKGGKLPGLTGGNSPTGGTDNRADGFSARYMWQTNGGLILYMYWNGMPSDNTWGEAFNLGTSLTTNQWYTLRQRFVMNTPGVANGVCQVWVDGVLKLNRSNMMFRPSGKTWGIRSLYWSVFFGGNNDTFKPTVDCYLNIDGVVVE